MTSEVELALLLEPDSPRPVREIADTLARHLELVTSDARARVRYGGGILLPRESAEVVEPIRDELRELGVRSRAIAAADLDAAPRPARITRLARRGETLWGRLPNHRELPIEFDQLRGIQVHALEDGGSPAPGATSGGSSGSTRRSDRDPVARQAEDNRRLAEAAVETGATRLSERVRKLIEWAREAQSPLPRLFLTLYPEPPLRAVRLERRGFDYAILEDRKEAHSLENFLQLAEWFVETFPSLVGRASCERFLETIDVESILHFKPEEAQNYDRWMHGWLVSQGERETAERDIEPAAGDRVTGAGADSGEDDRDELDDDRREDTS